MNDEYDDLFVSRSDLPFEWRQIHKINSRDQFEKEWDEIPAQVRCMKCKGKIDFLKKDPHVRFYGYYHPECFEIKKKKWRGE